MSWTKLKFVWPLLGLGMLLIAWQTKVFGFLLFFILFFLVTLYIYLRKLENLFLTLIVVVGLLGVAELTLSIVAKSPQTYFDPDSDYVNVNGYSQRINGFGYRPTEGIYSSRKLTNSGELIYDITYSIGDDGTRKSGAKKDFSVFLYGGSFAMGEGLNDSETLSYYSWYEHGINVKNLGVPGYGLHQALYLISIENKSSKSGVNLVLTAPWHALRSACKPSYSIGTPRYIVNNGYAELSGVCERDGFFNRVLNTSNIMKLVSTVTNNKAELTDNDLELYFAIVRSIKKHTDENNSKLIIAYIDAEEHRLATTSHTNESLLGVLSGIADEVVDVTLASRREELESKYYIHELDQHPTAIANKERAKILAPKLITVLDKKG